MFLGNSSDLFTADLPQFQGCFIGACTTTEEDLILGGLVLREGLGMGLTSTANGLRRVTPGSVGITEKLQQTGLLEVYREAGFTVGAPGCSYCVGMGVDKAGRGEVWLSSQNRNYKDRMGPGSIANLASAATVAASSFAMILQNPQPIIDKIDFAEYDKLRGFSPASSERASDIIYAEPSPRSPSDAEPESSGISPTSWQVSENKAPSSLPDMIYGKIQRFGDNVDTATFEGILEMDDDDEGGHEFSQSIVFGFLEQAEATFQKMETAV